MSIANLFNIPEVESDYLVFSFSNADQHRQIVDAVAAQKSLKLASYLLDPIPASDPATWLAIHQQSHNDFTAALGIAGVDLTSVDFNDPEQLASWIRLHAEEHAQAANQLGLR